MKINVQHGTNINMIHLLCKMTYNDLTPHLAYTQKLNKHQLSWLIFYFLLSHDIISHDIITLWLWLYGNWIYNNLCNQYLSPLMLWVRILIRTRCTTLCDKVCQWLATGRWFSLGPPVSSINKTDRHDKTKISLKVALNTIKQEKKISIT